MNGMMKLAQLFMKRPANKTIALIRVLFGLIIIAIFVGGRSLYDLSFADSFGISSDILEYFGILLGIFSILLGLFPLCLVKKKTMKRFQMFLGVVLFWMAIWGMMADIDRAIDDTPEISTEVVSEEAKVVSLSDIASTTPEMSQKEPSIWYLRFLLIILGLFSFFAGVSGKMIPSYCLKYKEKITTIRV